MNARTPAISNSANSASWASWFLAVRPKTLTAAIVPIGVGTALAWGIQSKVSWMMAVFAALSAIFIQIGTNLVNDALDFKKGADTAERVGPRRATQSGWLSPTQVMMGAVVCFVLATALAVPLVLQGGWTIVAIGLVSLFFAYGYTGGPIPLAYTGLGDLFVLLFFGLIAVSGVYFLHTGSFELPAIVAGAQVGLLATVLIAINNLRDHVGDAKVNKKTLAVRFGVRAVRLEIFALCFVPFLLSLYWLSLGRGLAAILPWIVFPLAFRIVRLIATTQPGPMYNSYLGKAAGLHLLFGLLLALGLIL